jgi:hypothetical protein
MIRDCLIFPLFVTRSRQCSEPHIGSRTGCTTWLRKACARCAPWDRPGSVQEIAYPNALRAKLAISDLLGRPLARLSDEEREWINGVLAETLGRTTVMARVRERFMAPRPIVAPVGTGEEGTPC